MTVSDAPAFPARLGQAAFWTARHPAPLSEAGRIPALFWLVDQIRPATVLGLGLNRAPGAGYLALCQGIDGLGLDSLAWGFGIGADPDTPDPAYARFSRLGRLNVLDQLGGRFEAGLFDLILLEGPETDDCEADLATTEALAALLPDLVSPHGVVALPCGTALAKRLAERFPTLSLPFPADLVVVLAGATPVPGLQRLSAADPDLAALARLGASHRLEAVERQAAEGLVALATAEAGLAAQTRARAEAEAALAEAEALRLRDLRLLTERLEAATNQTCAAKSAAEAALAAQQAEAQAERARLERAHFDALSDLQSELFVLTRQHETERAAAQASLAEARQAAERARAADAAEAQMLRQRIAALETELATQQAEAARTLAAQTARISSLQQAAAARDKLHRVQLHLREWQMQRLHEKPRLGAVPGPSGGKLEQEAAAVARHPLFDADWYQARNPDTRAAGLSAAEHFLRHGFYEGRDPGPKLQLLAWFVAHPDALAERRNPLLDPGPEGPGRSS